MPNEYYIWLYIISCFIQKKKFWSKRQIMKKNQNNLTFFNTKLYQVTKQWCNILFSVCAAGKYGKNCSDDCPKGFYGLFCAEKCSCKTNCDKVVGCPKTGIRVRLVVLCCEICDFSYSHFSLKSYIERDYNVIMISACNWNDSTTTCGNVSILRTRTSTWWLQIIKTTNSNQLIMYLLTD